MAHHLDQHEMCMNRGLYQNILISVLEIAKNFDALSLQMSKLRTLIHFNISLQIFARFFRYESLKIQIDTA